MLSSAFPSATDKYADICCTLYRKHLGPRRLQEGGCSGQKVKSPKCMLLLFPGHWVRSCAPNREGAVRRLRTECS